MFVVVNFDALAQASDIRIERRQVVFICWMQGSNLEVSNIFASRLNAHSQTDWAIEDQAKTWTQQPVPMISEHSAHSTTLPVGFRTWLWRYTCLLLLISMLWHRQEIYIVYTHTRTHTYHTHTYTHTYIHMRISTYHFAAWWSYVKLYYVLNCRTHCCYSLTRDISLCAGDFY